MDDTSYSHFSSDFQKLVDEGREEAIGIWNKVKKVTSDSHVMFHFYNGTAETFRLSSASWDVGALEEQYVIEPWYYLSFVLREDIPVYANGRKSTQAKHTFSYESENHAFEFSTSLKIQSKFETFTFTPQFTPQRVQMIKSTGKSPLRCGSEITRSMESRPYHYGVVICLG